MARSAERKSYSFKSIGKSQLQAANDARLVANERPIGIVTPLQFGRGNNGLFLMHNRMFDQLGDNLRNLINTNHGERVGHYDFGANLSPLTFELGNEDVDAIAIQRIGAAVGKYMPYVELQTFESFTERFDNQNVAKIGLRVTFTVPSLGPKVKAIDVLLYCAG